MPSPFVAGFALTVSTVLRGAVALAPVLAPLLELSADAQGYHSPDTAPPLAFVSGLPLVQRPRTQPVNARSNQRNRKHSQMNKILSQESEHRNYAWPCHTIYTTRQLALSVKVFHFSKEH